MEKHYKHIFIIIVILIIITTVYYKINKDTHKKLNISIKKNSLKIENFELSKRTKDKKGFYLIKSKIAKFSKSMNKIDMDFCEIEYKKDNESLIFSADKCIYLVEKELNLKNNIKGNYNNIYFHTGKNGVLIYDMVKEIGNINNEVYATQNNNSLKSDMLFIDKKQNLIKFINNVEATYEIK